MQDDPQLKPEPPVEWSRIATDLAATADLRLEIRILPQIADEPSYACLIVLDGRVLGSFGWKWLPQDSERSLADLAERLVEHSVSEEIWADGNFAHSIMFPCRQI